MEDLYWDAVNREMIGAIRTLRVWRDADFDAGFALQSRNSHLCDPHTLNSFVSQVTILGQEIAEIRQSKLIVKDFIR